MARWYQNVSVEGAVYEGPERERSRFWNEGKWDNFVAPLLPTERRTFLDIGCNAGLMLKLARDAGFTKAIGIEASRRAMQQAEQYRESVGGNWSLIPQVAGVNLDLDALPLADVTLLANVHYYIPTGEFAKLVDRLRHRTLYCIVVSAKVTRRGGKAYYDLHALRGYFRDWTELNTVTALSEVGDPAPRAGMYGVAFKSALHSQNVNLTYNAYWKEHTASRKFHFKALPPALKEFFALALSEKEFAYADTLLYKYWTVRNPKQSGESICRYLDRKQALAEDIRDNGIREPIILDHRGKFIDGLSRLYIAWELGHRHIIVRRL